jgi:hypothetical protein
MIFDTYQSNGRNSPNVSVTPKPKPDGGTPNAPSARNQITPASDPLSSMIVDNERVFPMRIDKTRSIEVKNQKYMGPRPIVVPVVPTPLLSIEALKDMSMRRAAKSHAIAARIIAEGGGPSARSKARARDKPKSVPPSSFPLLSIETLKDMSSQRAKESKDIAARILAEDKEKQKSPENNHFPCPAKKMGPAHNRNTAFFSIPLGSLHGMPLMCSHALCRKGRLKFVYCKYCNQPVSRMKFDERHAHPEQLLMAFADNTIAKTEGDDESDAEESTEEFEC